MSLSITARLRSLGEFDFSFFYFCLADMGSVACALMLGLVIASS